MAEFEKRQWIEKYGVVGQLAVEEFRTARPRITPFLAWRKQRHPADTISWDLMAEFNKVNPDDYLAPAYLSNMQQDER